MPPVNGFQFCCKRVVIVAVSLSLLCARTFAGPPHVYIFFGTDRDRIAESVFLDAKEIEGAQIKYTWKQLEHTKGEYDFAEIHHDFDFLTAHGKRLFIQLQDVSFEPKYKPFPKYLLSEPAFHGGADPQFDIAGNDENHAIPAGWVARRWDPWFVLSSSMASSTTTGHLTWSRSWWGRCGI